MSLKTLNLVAVREWAAISIANEKGLFHKIYRLPYTDVLQVYTYTAVN